MRSRLGTWGWIAILLLGAAWEQQGVVRVDWPTLTDLVERWIPEWAQAVAVGWVAYHFLIERREP